MLLVVTLWVTSPNYLIGYLGVVNRPGLWLLKWSGLVRVATGVEKPLCRFVIDPSLMALTLSGPVILLAWLVGAIAGKSDRPFRSAASHEPGDAKPPD